MEGLKGPRGPEKFLPSLGPCSVKEGDVMWVLDNDSATLSFIVKVMFDALRSANGGSIALANCKVYLCEVCFPGLI